MIALKPFNRIAAILCLCLLNHLCPAQGKAKDTWGKISSADFETPANSPVIDSSTSAIILSDYGIANFVGNKNGWFSNVYKRHTRIKILNKKAIGLASVKIEYYSAGDDPDKLSDIQAVAYNLENGQVVATRLDSKDIFEDRIDKEYSSKKFSIPGVKDGSIIEYTYKVTSEHLHIPSWAFQWQEYPCLNSEFQVEIPQTMYYVFVRQGVHPFAVDKGSDGNLSYRVSRKVGSGLVSTDDEMTVSANTVKHDWVMKNVPAFGSERYLSTPANYIDKIEFQLSKTYDGQDYHDQSNNWATATENLLKREDFGGSLDADNTWLDASIDKITAGSTNTLEQARAIYYYLSQHFTCTDHYDPYIKTNLHDAVKKNSGTVGDVNLLLVSMLRRRGINADPVLLSTREFGFNLATYPILQRLNYVIARVRIDGKTFYLDAAYPQLGFGQLAGNCYNGHARVISKQDSCSLWFWADSLREGKVTMVLITSSDKGFEGAWQSTLGKEESYEVRRKVAEHGEESYFKSIQTAYGDDCDISNSGIDSLERPEDPVKVHYDFVVKESSGAGILYFNPVMGDGWHENPFKAADRKYPVEMPYSMDETYVFSMQIPAGYAVEELPKSTKVAFNGDQGYFEYLVGQSGEMLQLRCRVKLNRATFQPEDYSPLREFFGYIVKKENEQIVLKKK
jgi:hypothetical protein